MSISVEKLLMGRTLKGTYFGGEVKKKLPYILDYLTAFHNTSTGLW